MTFTAAGGTPPTPPAISIANTSVQIATNGTANAVFPVTLSTTSASNVSVNYATQDGTATASTDYTAASGTLIFNAGQTNLTISVSALGRTAFKDKVTFTLLLSSPTNGTLSVTQATGTIVDNFLPVIQTQGLTQTNNSSVITFPSFSGISYTLRYTNIAGLVQPISTWPIVNTSVNGSGLTLSLTNNTSDTGGVYVLQGTRVP